MAQRIANLFENSPGLIASLMDILPQSLSEVLHRAAALDKDKKSRQAKRKAEPVAHVSSGQKRKRDEPVEENYGFQIHKMSQDFMKSMSNL